MYGVMEISQTSFLLASILSILVGVLILIMPKILNYAVAFYFIFLGIIGITNIFI